MRFWSNLVPELHWECENNGGEITDYYVDTFVDLAANAIPVIDRAEGTET